MHPFGLPLALRARSVPAVLGAPLTQAQHQAMEAIVATVPTLMHQAYGDELLAVVLLGSVARGTPHLR